jgi:NADH:ubiquinone oxidoreductase subunit 6 (subunit J)
MIISSMLFFIFSTFCLLSAIFVIFSKNPVFSILFLIFAFFNVSSLCFLFKFELLPISFLVIYVGAISVLFLFVLMMLNIKFAELNQTHYNFIPLSVLFGFFFLLEILVLFRTEFGTTINFNNSSIFFLFDFLNISSNNTNYLNFILFGANIQIVSFAFFTNFFFFAQLCLTEINFFMFHSYKKQTSPYHHAVLLAKEKLVKKE